MKDEADSRGRLSHIDARGRLRMVGVSGKGATGRMAKAEAVVRMKPETLEAISSGTVPKGDVFATARCASEALPGDKTSPAGTFFP